MEEHLTRQYGGWGTCDRIEFDIKAKAFMVGEIIREQRRLAGMTHADLANRTGVSKSVIFRVENGETDIRLSSLFRLLELGLGKRVEVNVR